MPDKPVVPRRKPQINIARSTAGRMWLIFCCAALAVIQSALSDRGLSLIVALTALSSAIMAELLITCQEHGVKKIKDGSAAASAMVLTLLLPNHIHPIYAALGALFAIAIVKQSFGGLGSNWLNPALGGWLFVRCSWPGVFSKALADAPGGIAVPPGTIAATALDRGISTALNNTVFSLFGADLPAGYIDLLIPRTPGIIADRGLLALLAGTVVISAFQVSRIWGSAVFLLVFGSLARISPGPAGGSWGEGDVLFALCSGGVMAAAFLLVAEPASGAKSRPGTLAAAVLGGVLSWFFRYQGLELYGCFFALALVNAGIQVIRLGEGRWFYSRKRLPGENTPEVQS